MQQPTAVSTDLGKLTRWRCHYAGLGGSKVMLDEHLRLDLPLYHRLEWRYAKSIFENSRLRLSPISSWPDPYESWWCDELFGRKSTPLHGVHAYALCWTLSKFDEPVWRMVGYGRPEPIVRLRCTVESLLACAQDSLSNQPGSWYIGRVRYRTTKRLLSLSCRLNRPEGGNASDAAVLKDVGRVAASLLIRKRRAFRFEEEVRLIFLDNNGSLPKAEVFLPLNPTLITDVMLSPHAKDKYAQVRRELAPYGIRLRRSFVLTKPKWMSLPDPPG